MGEICTYATLGRAVVEGYGQAQRSPVPASRSCGSEVGMATVAGGGPRRCRFELAPPRHFLYPSLLLLLSEEPRHGYRLVDAVLRLGFGPTERASIYRALSDLEADGLLHSWAMTSTAGSARQVYGVTEAGRLMLSRWMDIVAAERDGLSSVLKRFDALAGDGDGEGRDGAGVGDGDDGDGVADWALSPPAGEVAASREMRSKRDRAASVSRMLTD